MQYSKLFSQKAPRFSPRGQASLWLAFIFTLIIGWLPAQAQPFAYVSNRGDNTVSVIDAASNTVVATVPVGTAPHSVAVTPDGAFAYVTNSGSGNVSVIATATNSAVATVSLGLISPDSRSIAITPDGAFVYVGNQNTDNVSVIATATNSVVTTVSVGDGPTGIAITPDGAFAYVTNQFSGNVSVIATASNFVTATVSIPTATGFGLFPWGVAITPDGAFAYVGVNEVDFSTGLGENQVVVIATASNTIVTSISLSASFFPGTGFPVNVAITPDGASVYVTHVTLDISTFVATGYVSEIDIAGNTVAATVTLPTGSFPLNVAITPDGAFAYVPNGGTNDVSVIATASNTITAAVPVGTDPWGIAFGPAAAATGSISGTVTTNGNGLAGVTVKLLEDANPTNVIDQQTTDGNGDYSFNDVPAGDYQVMIVEPLGYVANQNFVVVNLPGGGDITVDFELTEIVTSNEARSKGYWKHQFDVYVKGKGNAQESEADLQSYIDEVAARYNSHFSIFAGATDGSDDFEDWQELLSVKGNAGMLAKAKSHLAALVMNLMSLKIAQYEVVTADGKTAGDVLTYVSDLVEDGDPTNDELAKDLAEQVNEQQTIAAGLVPSGNILYKSNSGDEDISAIPAEFVLEQNYPNPFNPTTTIRFSLPEAGSVSLRIYNSAGQLVKTLASGTIEAGAHNLVWDATNESGVKVASGIYFYKLQAGSFSQVRKMILMK